MSNDLNSRVKDLHAAGVGYRLRLGWPVRVEDDTEQVVLLPGEVVQDAAPAASRLVIVDMPSGLGSSVRSVLRAREQPIVVFAVPNRQVRWRFITQVGADRRRLPARSLTGVDVHVLSDEPVPLPPSRIEHSEHLDSAELSWIEAPALVPGAGCPLPRLTAVLAAVGAVLADGSADLFRRHGDR